MEQKIQHLDFYVMESLNHLEKWKFPKLNIKKSEKNVFMGSGSAGCVSKLFVEKFNGSALNISNYKRFFERTPKKIRVSIYIISASGGKDAINMAQFLKSKNLKANLITCNKDAPAKKFVKKIFVFPTLKEPPTYNVSTYSSMIYWLFKDDIKKIKNLIKKIEIPNLRKYKYIFFLASDKYDVIAEMASRKVAETLEGIGSNGDGFSNSVHGMLRQPNKKRLVFCLNQKYPLKEDVYELNIDSHLGLMLITYYIIGRNQTDKDTKNLLKNYQQIIKKLNWKLNKVF
jgi:fructoselysine-6-P-deglycase FrlB-like protein